MVDNFLQFKRMMLSLGLCDEYKKKLNECQNKEDLMNIVLDANGVSMLCDAQSFGWGMKSEYIQKEFGENINGTWQREKDGYTSALYVGYSGNVECNTTIMTLIDCDCVVYVPALAICKVYIGGGSNITVNCDGRCYIYAYKGCNVTHSGSCEVIELDKSEWI